MIPAMLNQCLSAIRGGRMVWYECHGGFIGFGSWSLSPTMVLTADSLEGNLSNTLLQPSSESVEDWKSEDVSSGTITANQLSVLSH